MWTSKPCQGGILESKEKQLANSFGKCGSKGIPVQSQHEAPAPTEIADLCILCHMRTGKKYHSAAKTCAA